MISTTMGVAQHQLHVQNERLAGQETVGCPVSCLRVGWQWESLDLPNLWPDKRGQKGVNSLPRF